MKFRGQLAAVSMLFSPVLMGQQATGATAPESFTHIDAQGTVYITRIAPVPETPLQIPADKTDRVLINLHGGGFKADSGSLIESVPVANLTQTKVVSVLYRLAPEHPFPAAVEDTVAVYKELLKTYKPERIGIYGSSAGAVLTPEVSGRAAEDVGHPTAGSSRGLLRWRRLHKDGRFPVHLRRGPAEGGARHPAKRCAVDRSLCWFCRSFRAPINRD
jgi:acetyl esterase/lipase